MASLLSDAKSTRFTLVAEDDAQLVVGFAAAGPERSGDTACDVELYAVYVLASHQRMGLGRALVTMAATRLAKLGGEGLLVWAFADNPWRHFYEKLGAVFTGQTRIYSAGGAELQEVAYAWKDLRAFLGINP